MTPPITVTKIVGDVKAGDRFVSPSGGWTAMSNARMTDASGDDGAIPCIFITVRYADGAIAHRVWRNRNHTLTIMPKADD
jgi:hypothetical protein